VKLLAQIPGMGSIPIARSITPVDAVGFTGLLFEIDPKDALILDAVPTLDLKRIGRGFFVASDLLTRHRGATEGKKARS